MLINIYFNIYINYKYIIECGFSNIYINDFIISTLSYTGIFILAPIEHRNNPLTLREIKI